MSINNYLRNPEFESDFAGYLDHTPLSYPMIPLQVGEDVCMVYEIPENEMQKILNKVNPYQKRNAEDLMFDELIGECFKWKQAIVLWYRNTNLLNLLLRSRTFSISSLINSSVTSVDLRVISIPL